MSKSIMIVLTSVALLGCMCAGCNKFTRVRYETVHIGTPQDEVQVILGRPRVKFSDSWTYVNEKPYYKAVIQFKGSRVSDKAWYDEKVMGEHPDSKFHRKGGPKETIKKRTTTP
ncbi:MAG: hypothetical protein ISS78_00135 [Phycisphaerae bacterium]|nr:hypothetical protein [Phycisphaerae bacterium]